MPPKKSKLVTTNQQVLTFLDEMIQESDNLNYKTTLKRAQESVKQYPLTLTNGKDCLSLKYIGDKIAVLIDKKFEIYNSAHGIETTIQQQQPTAQSISSSEIIEPVAKKTKVERMYIPSHRSGGYAIVLALSQKPSSTDFMSREEIIKIGQSYCDKSFIASDVKQFFGPWNSMKTLISKDLVCGFGRPPKFALTESGNELADILLTAVGGSSMSNVNIPTKILATSIASKRQHRASSQEGLDTAIVNHASALDLQIAESQIIDMEDCAIDSPVSPHVIVESQNMSINNLTTADLTSEISNKNSFAEGKRKIVRTKREKAMQNFEKTFLKNLNVEEYEIVIVIDNREVRKRSDRDFFQLQLEQQGVKCLTMPLALGDVCWCAREKSTLKLFMLDCIIERKCNSDLIASLIDNRFKEQKVIIN